MMASRCPGQHRVPSEWLAVALVVIVAAAMLISVGAFNRSFTPVVQVTVTSERAGLVMEPNAKVKLRGVQVGRVAAIQGGANPCLADLGPRSRSDPLHPGQRGRPHRRHPLFGAKFVDLVYPEHPAASRLVAGAVIAAQNVTTEVNTVFENLVALIKQIDPAKLNGIVTAMAEALRGQGQRIGEATTAANQVVSALNERTGHAACWTGRRCAGPPRPTAPPRTAFSTSSTPPRPPAPRSPATPANSMLLAGVGHRLR